MSPEPAPPGPASPPRRAAAWGVHLFTAGGAVWGLLALHAAAEGRYRAALGWMCVAVAVDGVDGVLARRVRVSEALPSIDGPLLDNLVDYLNYVVVPAFLLARAGVFPAGTALAASAAICLSSAYQFSQTEAKAGGMFFRGFPSYWNVVAVYLLAAGAPPPVALAAVAALCVMVFVPIYYVYPTRTPTLRPLTLSLGLAWGATIIAMVATYPHAPGWLVAVSLAYPLYYVLLSLWLGGRSA